MQFFSKIALTKTLLVLTFFSHTAIATVEQTPLERVMKQQSIEAESTLKNESVNSADKTELINLLSPIVFFNADFTQKVNDELGNPLSQGDGKFSVMKPNYMYWLTQSPNESLIVSDGDDLWLYDPFIEQATVFDLAKSIANTPILLLTSNDITLWDRFNVTKLAQGQFQVVSKENNTQVKSLLLTFDHSTLQENTRAKLKAFTIVDSTGQSSHIVLSNLDYTNKPSEELFKLPLPEGTYIDDQR